jgi:hypothetical protein
VERNCKARNAEGGPCQARPVRDSGYCWVHDPAVADRRAEWRREGGRKRSNLERAKRHLPGEPLDNEQLVAYLSVVFRGVITKGVEPKVATAAATVAKTMTEIRNAGAVDDLAAEVAELRAILSRGGAA